MDKLPGLLLLGLTRLAGKTLGIVGWRNRGVAELAAAFSMRVLACTPHPKIPDKGCFAWATMDQFLLQNRTLSRSTAR